MCHTGNNATNVLTPGKHSLNIAAVTSARRQVKCHSKAQQ